MAASTAREARVRRTLETPGAFSPAAVSAIADALNAILADSFALYLKTRNFHWHVSGPHFRDYHRLKDNDAASVAPPQMLRELMVDNQGCAQAMRGGAG